MTCTLLALPAVRWRWRRRRRPQVLPVWRAGPHRTRRECWKEGDSWHGLMHIQGTQQLPRIGAHLLAMLCSSLACSINSARSAEAWRPTFLPAVPQRWWRWRPLWWRRWWWLWRRWLRRRVSCTLHAGCWTWPGLGWSACLPCCWLAMPQHVCAPLPHTCRRDDRYESRRDDRYDDRRRDDRCVRCWAEVFSSGPLVLCLYQFL